MHNKLVKQIQENPVMTIVVTVLCTAITVFMTSSFATIAYVDREVEKNRQYVDEKHLDVTKKIDKIEKSTKTTESRVYDIWVIMNKK